MNYSVLQNISIYEERKPFLNFEAESECHINDTKFSKIKFHPNTLTNSNSNSKKF